MKGLQLVDSFTEKIVQMYEIHLVRFGICIVGPAGSGKTTCYRVLASALNSEIMNHYCSTVETSALNPKSVSMGELYGEFNALTQEWTDGLASTIMREYASRSKDMENSFLWTILMAQ